MIRESEHFHFAGVKSTEFNIRNVTIEEGLFNEPVIAAKEIEEIQIPGRSEPYFFGVKEEPRTLQLRFFFMDGWDDRKISRVIRWLNVDTYQPLYFSADVDKVFYVIPVDGVDKLHNGLKEGYLDLNMRCNSSKTYSHEIMTPTYNMEDMAYEQDNDMPFLHIGNKGHFSIYPQIWIEKINDYHDDIIIYNRTNRNEEFRFKNIDEGEKLFIHGDKQLIYTDKEDTYRYDDFNDNYLKLLFGENVLEITNNIKIRFSFRYIFS